MPPRTNPIEPLKALLAAYGFLVNVITIVTAIYISPFYWKQPYHTSALTGYGWVLELVHGHPERIRTELGVHLHVYIALVEQLRLLGMADSRYVKLEEQVAIFLYMSVTGLSLRHVAERFQRANDTVSYADDPVPDFILNNPKFYPFFENALGAVDGTHIVCVPSAAQRDLARNRKGFMSQNCLAICSFSLRFLYFVGGWDGSAADASIYVDSRMTDLPVPHGKYFLADSGFGTCGTLLLPYSGVRYHLKEWARADMRPATYQKLFNLRHATARNAVERIFGVVKARWDILNRPPHFSLDIQARIPPALAALHNFILTFDPTKIEDFLRNPSLFEQEKEVRNDFGTLANGAPSRQEKEEAERARDEIAKAMWVQYQEWLHNNNIDKY
ncbi:hypothetical protein D9757_009487 [Collybiopsis confluens]|uniref:DDE Tnp4 domain-containing protein n=1 Tax=Collybiopsis confluens TaxID=2823264 RepID=A0A8H5H4X0_9AGAR|nr:hypothetical protein D9757_009487 [Collybiopsis confluens]